MFGFKIKCFLFLMFGVTGISCRYVFKIHRDVKEVTELIIKHDFKDILKITPNVYSFEYDGPLQNLSIQMVLSEIKMLSGDKIVKIEPAKTYTYVIPVNATKVLMAGYFLPFKSRQKYDESANYFGMHVEDAWKKGYNGSGIYVAVVDIGVNADIKDLRRNLDMDMAYNFVNKTLDVTPEGVISNYKAESIRKIDHGNRCTSIIAAEKGNSLCNAGIAFDAKVVPLKVFSLSHKYDMIKVHSTSDVQAAALAFRTSDIHIYSNSWSPNRKFEPLDLAMEEAILHGATLGRNKLGAIYVVPDGSDGITGSGLANSLYTITVNSVGVGGTLPRKPQVSASVITSGLSDGNKLHTRSMMTSSYYNDCVESFKGVSAAVAEVSAIIALILHARSDLTIRDIQLILAESSEREELAVSKSFIRNAAEKYFHPVLGYGLLNADKAVSLAETWQPIGKLYIETLQLYRTFKVRLGNNHHFGMKLMTIMEFKMIEDPCRPQVYTIEHVMLRIGHRVIQREGVHIEIVSPSGTGSVIVDNENVENIDKDTSRRTLISTHFIGESPVGNWKVRIQFDRNLVSEHLRTSTSLIVYGTTNETNTKHANNCPVPTNMPTLHEENNSKDSKEKITNNGGITTDAKPVVTKSTKRSTASQKQLMQIIVYIFMCVIVKIYNTS